MNGTLTIRVVNDVEGFKKLQEQWNRLVEENRSYTPWFCWEWFDLCLRSGEQGSLLILLVFLDQELVAIAPMKIRKGRYKGFLRSRVVSCIGSSRSFLTGLVFGEVCEPLRSEITSSILNYLRYEFRAWDIFEIDPVASETERDCFCCDSHNEIRFHFRTFKSFTNCYSDAVKGGFEHFFNNLPKSTRKDILYCQRRMEKSGELRFHIINDALSLNHYLDIYDDIRSRSWKAAERDKVFIRELVHLAAAKGWLRLGILAYNERPIAGQKWFVAHKMAYIYDVVYDEDYKKYSPGKILTSNMLKYAIEIDGISSFDFLKGDEPYKEDWTDTIRERVGYTIFNKTLVGYIYKSLFLKILPLTKQLSNISIIE